MLTSTELQAFRAWLGLDELNPAHHFEGWEHPDVAKLWGAAGRRAAWVKPMPEQLDVSLSPHQMDCLERVAWVVTRFEQPAGSGKTLLMMLLAAKAIQEGAFVMMATTTNALAARLHEQLQRLVGNDGILRMGVDVQDNKTEDLVDRFLEEICQRPDCD